MSKFANAKISSITAVILLAGLILALSSAQRVQKYLSLAADKTVEPTQNFPSPAANPTPRKPLPSPTKSLSSFEVNLPPSTNNTQPTFKGTAKPGQMVKIEVNSENPLSGQVKVGADGTWSWTPPDDLSPGQHTVTLTLIDENGKTETVTREFTILTGTPILPITAGTPSATPVVTERPTPTEIITPPKEKPGSFETTFLLLTSGLILTTLGVSMRFLPKKMLGFLTVFFLSLTVSSPVLAEITATEAGQTFNPLSFVSKAAVLFVFIFIVALIIELKFLGDKKKSPPMPKPVVSSSPPQAAAKASIPTANMPSKPRRNLFLVSGIILALVVVIGLAVGVILMRKPAKQEIRTKAFAPIPTLPDQKLPVIGSGERCTDQNGCDCYIGACMRVAPASGNCSQGRAWVAYAQFCPQDQCRYDSDCGPVITPTDIPQTTPIDVPQITPGGCPQGSSCRPMYQCQRIVSTRGCQYSEVCCEDQPTPPVTLPTSPSPTTKVTTTPPTATPTKVPPTPTAQPTYKACSSENKCIVVIGTGTSTCAVDDNCKPAASSHKVCSKDNACVAVQGEGSDTCATNDNCKPTETHKVCAVNSRCETIVGTGTSTCASDANCQPAPSSAPSHKVCSADNRCLAVVGAGADNCTSDVSCQPQAVKPSTPESGWSIPTIIGAVGGLLLVTASLIL